MKYGSALHGEWFLNGQRLPGGDHRNELPAGLTDMERFTPPFSEMDATINFSDRCPNQFDYGTNYKQAAVWRSKTAGWALDHAKALRESAANKLKEARAAVRAASAGTPEKAAALAAATEASSKSKIVDAEVRAWVRSMGGDVIDYRQGRAKDIGRIVSEIYSPPRVTAAATLLPSLRCIPGFALDLTTSDADWKPWDFDILENRIRAKRLVEEQRPALLICTPMCTACSAWQRINN